MKKSIHKSTGAKLLAKALKDNDYSLRQAAKILKLNYATLSYLMSGRNKPSLKTATKLKEHFNIDTEEWLA